MVRRPVPPAGSGSDGPGSIRPGSDGPGSDGPGSDGPGSDRPGSDRPGSDRPGAVGFGAVGFGARWLSGAAPRAGPDRGGGGDAPSAPGGSGGGGGGRVPVGTEVAGTGAGGRGPARGGRARRPLRPRGGRVAPGLPVLRARALRVAYDGFTALDGVDLDLPRGRITAVVGPNGAGKSTLFHCLAGTVRPVSGRVVLGERDITRLPAHARTRLGVARTFQQLAVFPTLTVAENVHVGAEQGRVVDPGALERALRLLGLDGAVRTLPAADLPTGTLRRVELARALAGSPRVLLLDEPAAGLDTGEVTALAGVLRALAADGTTLLVVEHDLDLVADLADTVHVMTAGRVVASGPVGHVLEGLDVYTEHTEFDGLDRLEGRDG
ncbi:ABC transporter ATP-binding protein [Streptomyces tauricus]|uniref:ABC transporter ATP-binding protein n=1 Tax=Streptomyces tauricus TaxID=68274 RepID=UPI00387EF7C4